LLDHTVVVLVDLDLGLVAAVVVVILDSGAKRSCVVGVKCAEQIVGLGLLGYITRGPVRALVHVHRDQHTQGEGASFEDL
jgi:hypothetical protein